MKTIEESTEDALKRANKILGTNYQDWELLSKHPKLTENLIRKFANFVSWDTISIFQHLSEDFICDIFAEHPIIVSVYNKHADVIVHDSYAKDGKYNSFYNGECTLFPSKDQRDWSKFERFWDRKFDLNTLKPFDKVLVRNRKTELWLTDMFTFHIDEPVAKCITGAYMQCIPYNEDTKHLLGTTDDCPEYCKWWEE